MATLGTALMGGLMAQTEAEKMVRPWWDAIEDFVIYGLIMLGLIVAPTTIFNGTPLFCNLCSKVNKSNKVKTKSLPDCEPADCSGFKISEFDIF